MLEAPELTVETIAVSLENQWRLTGCQITFLPLGADLSSAVYRVVAHDGTPYFLKLRAAPFDDISVALASYLSNLGIGQIIAPLPTADGDLHTVLAPFLLTLYPFVAGMNGYERDLSGDQWIEFGAAMRRIHTATLPPDLQQRIPQETFSSRWLSAVRDFLTRIQQEKFAEPTAMQVAAVLREQRSQILDLIERCDILRQAIAARPPEFVLCHSDLHAGNLLIEPGGRIYIVDWDSPILAPKERDLMYAGGGLMGGWRPAGEEETLFYRGYGDTWVNQAALAYYRYHRIVEDIAVFCQQLLDSTGGGDDREQALIYLKSNFLPDGAIAIARSQDRT